MTNFETLSGKFKDKDIALVGNSLKLFDSDNTAIDQHEVVVRINRAWALSEQQKQKVGKRIDVLFASTEKSNLDCVFRTVPTVVWMTPKHREEVMSKFPAIPNYPVDWWNELIQLLGGARPSTGCMGVHLISKVIGKGTLTLYGFDFFQSPNWWKKERLKNRVINNVKLRLFGVRYDTGSPHDGTVEESYIRNALPEDRLRIR